MQLDSAMSAAEAAERLGVSSHEIRRLLDSGDLRGRQIAGRWFVPVQEVQRWSYLPRPSGRPYSPRSCWAMLQMIEGQQPDISASRNWQLRQYLLDREPFDLAGRLRRRASRQLLLVHSSLLSQLVGEDLVLRAGVSAARAAGADLLVRDELAELYVHARDFDQLRADYHLREADHLNVIAHVVPAGIEVPFSDVAPRSLVALDLMESGEPRAVDAGRRLWRTVLQEVRR